MIHRDFSHADFIITPRAILFLMMRQAEGGLDFLHGEKVVAEDAVKQERNTEKKFSSGSVGVVENSREGSRENWRRKNSRGN